MLALLLAGARAILLERFAQLERDQVRVNMDRVLNAVENSLDGLQATAKDYGNWDDTYAYLAAPSEAYIKANFVDATFTNLKLEVLVLADAHGRVVYSQGFDMDKKEMVPVPEASLALFASSGFYAPGLLAGPSAGRRGLLLTGAGPLLVVAKPVLTSEEKGPAKGVIIMGRFLDADEVKDLAALTLLDVSLCPLAELPVSLAVIDKGLRSPAMGMPVAVRVLSGSVIEGLTPVRDMTGAPIGAFRLTMDRQLYEKGVTGTLVFLAILVLGGVFFAAVFGVILERTVLGRLARLSAEVAPIRTDKDLSRRVRVQGKDEIAALENSINGMLDGLERSDRENHAIAAELQAARDAAEAASTAKGQFLATMSHEIRTPMNAVLGLTELALEATPPARMASYLGDIRKASLHLMSLIEDVLDFSKIEAGKLELEHAPFCLAEVVAEVEVLFRGAARAKGLTLSTRLGEGLPAWVMGDSLRLRQVLANLVNNAIKFTSKGTVSLEVSPSGQGVRFAVRDTGIGIDPALRETVFQPFAQADSSTTRLFGGTGLGLTISRELTQRMGGELAFTSQPGAGSLFAFTLPLETAGEGARQDGAAASAVDLAGAVVLVAEDNVFNRRVVREMLTLAGVDTVLAEDGKQAAMAVLGARFDAVLMDMHMPELDGLEATRLIRGYAGPEELPIIAMTAAALAGDRQCCLDAGMNDFVVKPVSRQTLLAVLGKWIRRVPQPPEHPGPGPSGLDFRPEPPEGASSGLELSRVEGIDLPKALGLYDGRPELLARILSRFPGDFRDTPGRIAAALDAGDLDGARLLAHSLKGAAGNIAADALARAARDVESASLAGNVPDARQALAALAPLLERLFASIASSVLDASLSTDPAHTSETIPPEG